VWQCLADSKDCAEDSNLIRSNEALEQSASTHRTGHRLAIIPPSSSTSVDFSGFIMSASSEIKKRRFRLFGSKRADSPKPQTAGAPQPAKTSTNLEHDSERTRLRQEKACELLLSCIPKAQKDETQKVLDFAALERDTISFDEEFTRKANSILELRTKEIKDAESRTKCQEILYSILACSIPFSKNFLSIASAGSEVISSIPFGVNV
jgi:hypothetical protein